MTWNTILKWSLFIALIISIGVNFTQYAEIFYIRSNEYWDTAPDGVYRVFCFYDKESEGIFAPICDCCPTDLHGYWECENNVINEEEYGWYIVVLINNIVINAWKD